MNSVLFRGVLMSHPTATNREGRKPDWAREIDVVKTSDRINSMWSLFFMVMQSVSV
jgi:hypothetical protein